MRRKTVDLMMNAFFLFFSKKKKNMPTYRLIKSQLLTRKEFTGAFLSLIPFLPLFLPTGIGLAISRYVDMLNLHKYTVTAI